MTDRHLAALDTLTHGHFGGGGSQYNAPPHATSTLATAPSPISTQATLHYHHQQQQQQHQQHQQRLHYEQQQQARRRYHDAAAAYQAPLNYAHYYAERAALGGYFNQREPFAAAHYAAERLLAASGGSRYAPYQQQHELPHGMYSTPQHLFYAPPSTAAAYHSLQQQHQMLQQQQQFHHQQQQQRHNLGGNYSDGYNPYSISQHHYQQSLLSAQQQQQQYAPRMSHETPAISNNNVATYSQQPHQSADCLTISPPLISGTDSGISSSGCSTRGGGTHSDSTQSTPVYSAEYPLSVGSSSGMSYHYGDGKELDDSGCSNRHDRKIDEPVVNSSNSNNGTIQDVATTTLAGSQPHLPPRVEVKLEPVDDACSATVAANCNQISTTQKMPPNISNSINNTNNTCRSNLTSTVASSCLRSIDDATSLSSNMAASCAPPSMNSSPANVTERSATTPCLPQAANSYTSQQQQKSSTTTKNNLNNSWSPFPNSPNRYDELDATARNTSPVVPVPPHNSPVDYAPPQEPVRLTAAPAKANHKNRIIECDLIPNKTSTKRKLNTLAVDETSSKTQNTTPLPAFQQAFGSTEIGRFSERFLITPPTSAATTDPYAATYDDENHTPPQHYNNSEQHNVSHYAGDIGDWTSFDPYLDYSNGANMQYRAGHNYAGYAGRYGLSEARTRSERDFGVGAAQRAQGVFSEIRCNGI